MYIRKQVTSPYLKALLKNRVVLCRPSSFFRIPSSSPGLNPKLSTEEQQNFSFMSPIRLGKVAPSRLVMAQTHSTI